jgi:hypothetical protein
VRGGGGRGEGRRGGQPERQGEQWSNEAYPANVHGQNISDM